MSLAHPAPGPVPPRPHQRYGAPRRCPLAPSEPVPHHGPHLGVAVLCLAVAATAGSLTNPDGVAAGYSRGFVVAAVIAALVAVVAFVRMPSTRLTGGTQMHMH